MIAHETCRHPATDYARGNCDAVRRGLAREARGECYWCGTPGVPAGAWCPGCGEECPTCGDPLTGAAWGSRGECLDCHQRAMLPPEDFAAECIGLNYGALS